MACVCGTFVLGWPQVPCGLHLKPSPSSSTVASMLHSLQTSVLASCSPHSLETEYPGGRVGLGAPP